MLLQWRDVAPIPDLFPDLKVWTSLTTGEAETLRRLARGKSVLEIGAAFGYSTLVLASVAGHVVSIDPHTAPIIPGNFNFTEAADMERYKDGTLKILTANMGRAGLESVEIISELSQNILPYLKNAYDFAFIDGDHSYVVEMNDIFQCEKLGINTMAIHDYDEDLNPAVRDVVRDWLLDHQDWTMTECVDTLAVLSR